MNYNISASELHGDQENFSFDSNPNLTKQSISPATKKIKLISTPTKKALNFDNTSLASPLSSDKESQTCNNDPLMREMLELLPDLCKFLSEFITCFSYLPAHADYYILLYIFYFNSHR